MDLLGNQILILGVIELERCKNRPTATDYACQGQSLLARIH